MRLKRGTPLWAKVQQVAAETGLVLVAFTMQVVAVRELWNDVSTRFVQLRRQQLQWLLSCECFLEKGLILIIVAIMLRQVYMILYNEISLRSSSVKSVKFAPRTKPPKEQHGDGKCVIYSGGSSTNSTMEMTSTTLAPIIETPTPTRECWTSQYSKGSRSGLEIFSASQSHLSCLSNVQEETTPEITTKKKTSILKAGWRKLRRPLKRRKRPKENEEGQGKIEPASPAKRLPKRGWRQFFRCRIAPRDKMDCTDASSKDSTDHDN